MVAETELASFGYSVQAQRVNVSGVDIFSERVSDHLLQPVGSECRRLSLLNQEEALQNKSPSPFNDWVINISEAMRISVQLLNLLPADNISRLDQRVAFSETAQAQVVVLDF